MGDYRENVQKILDRFSYSLGEIFSDKITAYATQSPSYVYIDFNLEVDCNPLEEDGRSQGTLLIKGDATFDPSNNQFVEIRRLGEEFKFTLADGTEESAKNVVLRADSIVLGHREVQHTIRYEL